VNNIRNEKLLKKFGQHVKELREKKGWSQETLANEADVPISQIGRIERGEVNCTLSTIDAIAGAFKISVSNLLNI
jgi:transcriptional regulator with XRE-family HTH domain